MRFNRFSGKRFTLRDPETGGEGGGGGGVDPPAGGGTQPSEAEAKLLKEVMDKKAKLREQKEAIEGLTAQVTDFQTRLKAFDGIDVAQVQELLAAKAKAETDNLEKKGEWDRLRTNLVSQHETALTTFKTESQTKLGELEGKLKTADATIVDLTIGRAFGDSNYVRDQLTLTPAKARVIYGPHFELKDGKVVAYDKPAGASERTPLQDANGKPLPFEEAMKKIIESDADKDQLIKSTIRAGAGSRSDGGKGAPQGDEVGSGRERIAASLAAGKLKMPPSK
jgi:hypothetical protein